MKNPWIIIGAIVVVLIGGSVWYSSHVSKVYNEGVVVKKNEKGNLDSKITLVEYSDFQCPACGKFEPVVQDVLAKYGDKIKFEYKHFPLQMHPFAIPASKAAEAAGQQDKFFAYHDLLFKNQDEWTVSTNPTGLFIKYATDLGLDVDKFKNHMQSSVLYDHIKSNMADGQKLGVTGTPTFYLNGTKLELSSIEDFMAQIENAVTPKVDFTLEGNDEKLKMIKVNDADASTSSTTPVSFGM